MNPLENGTASVRSSTDLPLETGGGPDSDDDFPPIHTGWGVTKGVTFIIVSQRELAASCVSGFSSRGQYLEKVN